METLRDRTALVTGASRGIGTHIARALARAGVRLAVTARAAEPLEALAERLTSQGASAVPIAADVTSPTDRTRLVESAAAALGRVDILVNNAGIESAGAFLGLDPTAIDRTVATNVVAPMQLARALLPGMLERGLGHVVNISSLGGKRGAAYDAVYCGTKAALLHWANGLRAELRGTGVGVSTVCPGYVTGEGMFATFGIAAPRTIGSCTPEQVAAAVIEAIRRDRPELIVNSLPIRPLLALAELSPRLADGLTDLLGVTGFQRRKVGAGRS